MKKLIISSKKIILDMRNYGKITVFVLGFLFYTQISFGQKNIKVDTQQESMKKLDSLKTAIEQEMHVNEQVLKNELIHSFKDSSNVTKEDIYKIIDAIYIYFNEDQKAKVGELKEFINSIPNEFNAELFNQLVDLKKLLKRAYPELSK